MESLETKYKTLFDAKIHRQRIVFALISLCVVHGWGFVACVTLLHINLIHPSTLLSALKLGLFSPLVWLFWIFSLVLAICIYPFRVRLTSVEKHKRQIARSHLWLGFGFFFILSALMTSYYILFAAQSRFLENDKTPSIGGRVLFLSIIVSVAKSLYQFVTGHEYKLRFGIVQHTVVHNLSDLFLGPNSLFLAALRRCVHSFKLIAIAIFVCELVVLPIFSPSKSVGFLQLIWQLMDVSLFLTVFLLMLRFEICDASAQKFIELFSTQAVGFSIPTPRQIHNLMDDSELYLTLALNCKEPILLKYLAFWDLACLSGSSRQRRAQIYAISLPGGHPRNWDAVSGACISLLTELLQEIQKHNSRLTGVCSQTQVINVSGRFDKEILLKPRHLEPWDTNTNVVRMRRMAAADSSVSKGKAKQDDKVWHKVVVWFSNSKDNFEQIPSLEDCQLHVWAVESLSLLVLASYTEDQYGVVQKDLPKIIAILLDLHAECESFARLRSALMQTSDTNGAKLNDQQRNILVQSISTAIYRIMSVFEKHLRDIALEEKHRLMLKNFTAC